MTPSRKAPHCKTCHKPLKGHKRGICDPTDAPPSRTAVPPSCSVSAKTQKSVPPLERLPTLSTESSQILNDILRANSHSTPEIRVFKRTGPRISGRRTKPLRMALDTVTVDDGTEQKPGEKTITASKHDETLPPDAGETAASIPLVQSQTNTLPPSSSCLVTQQLVVRTSNKGSALDPLTITMSQHLKLEDSSGGPCNSHPQLSASDIPSADLTIQNFLDSMARNTHHPPATIFSYPVDATTSLENSVRSHGLRMHILPLPNSKEEWVPVVIGRDTNAITKLLEDGEKLAQGLRQPDRFKDHEFDLGISHVVVGALGALATWAGLAYT